MRTTILTIAAAIMLASCQATTNREPVAVPPLNVAKGNGAVSIKLCFDGQYRGILLSPSIQRVDSEQSRIARSAATAKQFREELDPENTTFLDNGEPCKMWQFQTRPGVYALAEVGYRITARPSSFGSPVLTILNATRKTNYGVQLARFVDDFGGLSDKTPTFEVSDGVIARLGTLTYRQHHGSMQVPVKDSSGNWDGQSTDIVPVITHFLDYQEPQPGEPDNGAPVTGNVSGISLQPLTPLIGQEIHFALPQ
jgi:hypothetical protein